MRTPKRQVEQALIEATRVTIAAVQIVKGHPEYRKTFSLARTRLISEMINVVGIERRLEDWTVVNVYTEYLRTAPDDFALLADKANDLAVALKLRYDSLVE